ncbi:MAG: hypothetical protein IJ391_03790, partial [Clostridia bacterium]|nr:hypothetical protein [Clostridia bacterium]
MNNHENNTSNKTDIQRSKPMRFFRKLTIGKIFKFIAVFLIAAVYVLLIGRMLLARNYGIMNRYVWTENALYEYSASPESFSVMSHQLSESIDEDGYYHISNYTYVPEISELQITVRYNNSTLDKLDTYYTDRSDVGETFVFTLEDDKGNIYDTYKYASSSNFIYNFRRLIFEGIDFENVGTLYLNIY